MLISTMSSNTPYYFYHNNFRKINFVALGINFSPYYKENKIRESAKFQVIKVTIIDNQRSASHSILKVHRHVKRNVTTYDNDIAILTLDRNVPFTSWVKPICVGNQNIKVKPGDKVPRAELRM